MSDSKLTLDQINPDAALIIIRLETTQFPTLEGAKRIKEHLKKVSREIGKPVLFLNRDHSVEQLNDDQLRNIGLQRIPTE